METTTLPPVTVGHTPNLTFYDLILNADPIVKGVMLILVIASVICWAIILEKTIRLIGFGGQGGASSNSPPRPGSPPSARHGLRASCSRPASASTSAPRKAGWSSEARMEKAMRLAARLELSRLQPRMRFLATVGSTAPFIGLFGTVWGIMNSFTAIAAAEGHQPGRRGARHRRGAVRHRLGLVAAIPAVIAYNKLSPALGRAAQRVNSPRHRQLDEPAARDRAAQAPAERPTDGDRCRSRRPDDDGELPRRWPRSTSRRSWT